MGNDPGDGVTGDGQPYASGHRERFVNCRTDSAAGLGTGVLSDLGSDQVPVHSLQGMLTNLSRKLERPAPPMMRPECCAIYIRKSSAEEAEQNFNSNGSPVRLYDRSRVITSPAKSRILLP
jgi:hypothetical protein